jgi:uroporphyrinogen decarboxylase
MMELGIAKNIKEGFLGKPVNTLSDEVEFMKTAGYDFVKLQPKVIFDMPSSTPDMHTDYDEDEAPERKWAAEHFGLISTMADAEKYPFPKPEDVDYSNFEKIKEYLPENMKVIGQYGDIFTMTWVVMGFERFSMALFEEPELVDYLFKRFGECVYNLFENMVDFDIVQAMWYSDDLAYTEGLMISPMVYRQYLFPWVKKIGNLCKKKEIPFIYHSDGVLHELMDDFLDCGVNALHPIEPKAMDIVELKKKWAEKLCLIGNIDLAYTLTRGTPEETDEEVKERIRTLGPGGGYIVCSSNSVPDYVKLENYKAMVEAVKKYGKYPISL